MWGGVGLATPYPDCILGDGGKGAVLIRRTSIPWEWPMCRGEKFRMYCSLVQNHSYCEVRVVQSGFEHRPLGSIA